MREYYITKNDSGQRLNKFLEKAVPRLSGGMMHKYLRLKRIKLNGRRTEAACRLAEGDRVQLYINDEYFEQVREEEAFRRIKTPRLTVVYEDENILLADKAPGMVVHADEKGDSDTLIAHIQAYLYQSGAWNPDDAASFAPALCNRIDRNTGGIVIAAKNAESLRVLNQKIRDRELVKLYLCVVQGELPKRADTLTAYLEKLSDENRVIVSDRKTPQNRTILTKYRVLETRGGNSLLEVDLLTGRTHQIRAHFAHVGHPLLGDGKYGSNKLNKALGYDVQALYSYKLRFEFTTPAGCLEYLNHREFSVTDMNSIWFVKKFHGSD